MSGTLYEFPFWAPAPQESFERGRGVRIWRQTTAGSLGGSRSYIVATARGSSQDALRAAWDQAWLRGALPIADIPRKGKRVLRIVDLFSGCGAMSLGLRLAAESLGFAFESLLAADTDLGALGVYRRNLAPVEVYNGDLGAAVTYRVSRTGDLDRPSVTTRSLERLIGKTDVLIGGPPCQGHSDLNNHSRRSDPKNSLYLLMPAAALVLRPAIVIIENVPAVVHDRSRVVQRTVSTLRRAGYSVADGVVSMADLGVAQRRRRHVMVAVHGLPLNLERAFDAFRSAERPVSWAIGDLQDVAPKIPFETPSIQNAVNRGRIEWLFDNDALDLPNRKRPLCHRDGKHSYVSMYGRMKWDEPAQTVTSGFGSPGQGRYIHATRRRTLTPHEAARLQFFPDSFCFETPARPLLRTELGVMIGNAVPPKLSYILGLAALAAASNSGPLGSRARDESPAS